MVNLHTDHSCGAMNPRPKQCMVCYHISLERDYSKLVNSERCDLIYTKYGIIEGDELEKERGVRSGKGESNLYLE